ncbi:MAG: hypothetical protein EOP83_05135 [Verrucomicrobiaceae bacterium]|nr:MAG: hypothetical protein EOP83_05135 [Verrucomicrobiaceae bacterium]
MSRKIHVATERVRHRLLTRPSPFKRVPITQCTLTIDTEMFTRELPLDERFREYWVIWRWCMENIGPNLTGWMWEKNRVYIIEDAIAMAFVMRWRGAEITREMCASAEP